MKIISDMLGHRALHGVCAESCAQRRSRHERGDKSFIKTRHIRQASRDDIGLLGGHELNLRLLDTSELLAVTGYAGRAAVYGGVLAAVYLVTAFIARFIFRAEPKFLGVLGVAALNTLLLAVPYINNSAAYSFADSIGSGIGAGIAFVLAAALIGKGAELLNSNDRIPQVFKGAPAMLLYVGLLSLAFAGFTDSTLFT